MLLLAVGLGVVLRLYKRLGILADLKPVDYFLLALVLGFTLRQGHQIYQLVAQANDQVTLTAILNWVTDPLLSCLLVEAVLIRRAVVSMGWGLISKSWGAYTAAIFLTSLAHIITWADTLRIHPLADWSDRMVSLVCTDRCLRTGAGLPAPGFDSGQGTVANVRPPQRDE